MEKAQSVPDAARKMLFDCGFPSQNINTKFVFRQFGTVKDIIREAKSGRYDAVVLGRRGYILLNRQFQQVSPDKSWIRRSISPSGSADVPRKTAKMFFSVSTAPMPALEWSTMWALCLKAKTIIP